MAVVKMGHDKDENPSKAELRRTAKPLMEKKRRARMNASLMDLMDLLPENMKKNGLRSNKMEKTEILETTVQYVTQTKVEVQKAQSEMKKKYTRGFLECLNDLTRYVTTMPGLNNDSKVELLQYLSIRGNKIGDNTVFTGPNNSTANLSNSNSIMTAHVKPLPSQTIRETKTPEQLSPSNVSTSIHTNFTTNNLNQQNNKQLPVMSLPSSSSNPVLLQAVQPSIDNTGIQLVNNMPILSGQLGHGNVTFVIPTSTLNGSTGYMLPVHLGVSDKSHYQNLKIEPNEKNANSGDDSCAPLNLSLSVKNSESEMCNSFNKSESNDSSEHLFDQNINQQEQEDNRYKHCSSSEDDPQPILPMEQSNNNSTSDPLDVRPEEQNAEAVWRPF